MMHNTLHNKSLGVKGESIAADYLREKDYSILKMNWTSRWGEIDIIATYRDRLVFVEVKSKTGYMHGKPYEAVTYSKMRKLLRAAQFYIKKEKRTEPKYAIEVVSVVLSTSGEVIEIQHFDNIQM